MLGTRRSVGQFIPQYRTDGQYDHTKTWACVRKAQSTETPRATPKVVPSDHVGDPAQKPPSEARASGAIQNSGRWSVRRAERCEESRQRISGSGKKRSSSSRRVTLDKRHRLFAGDHRSPDGIRIEHDQGEVRAGLRISTFSPTSITIKSSPTSSGPE